MNKFLVILCFLVIPFYNLHSQNVDEALAVQYYSNGEYEKAAAIFEKLYQKSPSIYYYNYLVNAYVEGKNYTEAEKFIKKLLKQDKLNMRYKVDLGYVYKKSDALEKANKEFEEALKNVAADRISIINLANAFLIRYEQDYAIKTYNKGKANIKDYTFGLELGGIYDRIMKYEEMMKEYIDLIELNTTVYLSTVQQILQNSLANDPEGKKSEALKMELLKRIQLNPGQTFYSEMLLWHSIQQKDFDMAFLQAKALDKRLKQSGTEVYNLGELALSNEAYEIAVMCFQYILDKGEINPYYVDSRINLLHAEYNLTVVKMSFDQNAMAVLEKKYLALIDDYGISRATVPLIKDLTYLQAFYMNKTDAAIKLLNEVINASRLPAQQTAECKLQLADILLLTNDVWEATLLYSQIEKAFKNAPIAHEAKYKNARLSYYINEFDWAKAQLDVLKASTSKLIANDALELSLLISDNIDFDSSYVPLSAFARADLLQFQNKNQDALLLLDSIIEAFTGHPIIDDVLFKKGEIFTKMLNFEKADNMFEELINKFPYSVKADNALYKRALLHENVFKNTEKAMELYQNLINNYLGSLFTVDARKRFRALRGDVIN